MTASTQEKIKRPNGRANHRRRAMWWRWYHFYFALALFDLVVIVASLTLYHRALASYSVALSDLARIDESQDFVTNLRIAVVQLNAPGNDVFASRRVDEERSRFQRTRKRYDALVNRQSELGVDLGPFQQKMTDMFLEEERIFEIFDRIVAESLSGQAERVELNSATNFMASMDRYQAEALQALDAIALAMSREERRLLSQYGAGLARSASLEKYLIVVVGFILVGMLWYGRKLQRTHEELIAQQQRAIEEKHARLAAVGEVCSAVSHGIRNPLAAISSSAQLVMEYGTLDEATRLRVQDIVNESNRLNDRVNRLLDFSNAKQGVFEVCDITEVVGSALREIEPKLDDAKVVFEDDFGDKPLFVQGDREWLSQTFIELVSNSMDYLPDGGHVKIVCRPERGRPGWVQIDVYDDGPGIPEHAREHVFDLFYTSKAEGNGIGLATVKRVIDMHGGLVTVVNGVSKGAHIQIRLPMSN
jgi:signal transduction histidine kinase